MNDISVEGLASTYPAGTDIARHSHATHQIVHTISGVLHVQVSDALWVVVPGRALWVPARFPHQIHCPHTVEMRTVYLAGNHPAASADVRVIGVSSLMREIMVRLAEGCEAQQIPHLTALLLDEISTMQTEPFHLPMAQDSRIARLIKTFLSHPADQTTMGEWAENLGFSQRSLIRVIRAQTGLSFRSLRRQARLMAAVEMLSRGQAVTSVALDVGFESPSAFIHAFRQTAGTTPRRYIHKTG